MREREKEREKKSEGMSELLKATFSLFSIQTEKYTHALCISIYLNVEVVLLVRSGAIWEIMLYDLVWFAGA